MISLTSPVETRAHRWPAALKLALLCISTLGLFYVESLPALALICVGVLCAYSLPGRLFLTQGLRGLMILWPFVVVVGLWHLWEATFAEGAVIVLRMIAAVALANLVTMTTRLSDMIDVVKRLLAPFRRVGLPVQAIEITIALVIRMTPVLLAKAQRLTEAWRARTRRRPTWRLVLPFMLVALDDADYVADALKARGGILPPEEK